MSSSHSSGEFADEGIGYAVGMAESSSSVSSSIMGSDDRRSSSENTSEGDVELDIDDTLEWSGDTPPPVVKEYTWAPEEVGMCAPDFITSASIEYLTGRVSLLSRIGMSNSL